MKIRDITGQEIEITNLAKAIQQCKRGLDSPFKMDSGYNTQGENYAYILKQLEKIKNDGTD